MTHVMKNDMLFYIRNERSVRKGRTRVLSAAHSSSFGSALRTLLLLLLIITMGVNDVLGQTHPYEGVWFMKVKKNENYYMVPAANPQVTTANHVNEDAYFSSNYSAQEGDPEKPFITTYQTKGDLNSIWIFVPVSDEDNYYYIVHAKTGKYVKYQPYLTGNNARRKYVHLETMETPGETEKFEITARNEGVKIKPKNNDMYFNVAGDNQNRYNGGTSSPYYSGMVGGMSGTDDNSQFKLIDASSAADLTPIISDLNEADNTFTITSPAAAFSTIRYTTDGSTTPNASIGTTATSGSPITISDSWTVQAVGVFSSFITPLAGPKSLSPAKCITPVITYSNGQVTITTGTEGANIYYTTDGTDPTTTSTEYSSAISVSDGMTIKAIATKTGLPNSNIASLTIVLTPTITIDGEPFTYNGIGQEPTVTVKKGETVIDPSEYTISYSNNINVGSSATVTITDNEGGEYYVAGSTTFTISPMNIGSGTTPAIDISIDVSMSGSDYVVTVKHGNTTLTEGTDYTWTGGPEVTVTGIGNYSGTAKATYVPVTPGYYALHQNGAGYLKVNGEGVNLSNDGTFRYSNVFDNNGNCIWYLTPEGYLQNEYFYLNVANNRTLYLDVTPVTRWRTEEITGNAHGKQRIKINDGTQDLYICYDSSNKVIKLQAGATGIYNACPITITEESWNSTPSASDLTLQSPQLVTYLRASFKQNISYEFYNDSGTKVTEQKKDRTVYGTLAYASGGDGKGTDWDIDESGVLYNIKASGDAEFTATYNILPADPVVRAAHPTPATKDIKYKVTKKPLNYAANTDYLLFSIPVNDNYRYPYDDGIADGNPVKPNGMGGITNESVLTDPSSNKNEQISWKITADSKGFYTFQNTRTNKYLYFDETPHASSDYGTLCVGSAPSGNSAKFRLYKAPNDANYGTCFFIIPYSKIFAVYKSDGLANGLNVTLNVKDYTDGETPVISLFKPNINSTWCIYKYEAEYRVTTDFIISGNSSTSETGNQSFTSEGWYGKFIKESPNTGKGQRGLVISGTYDTNVTYAWTVEDLSDYSFVVNGADNKYTATGNSGKKLTLNVTSLPVSTTSGIIKLTISGGTAPNVKTSPEKTFAFTILSDGTVTFTEISSLSQIASSSGTYRLVGGEGSNFAYSDSNKPGVTTFSGVLDGNNQTISSLSAPLFDKLSNGTVRNVNLSGVNISSHSGPTGAIAGTADGGSRIYNVGILDGEVGSSDNVCGGLVGKLDGSARVINCFNYATITGGTNVGGIVGYNNYESKSNDMRTMVMNCMFYGDITGGTSKAPVYNGKIITNRSDQNGVGNFNYFWAGASYVQNNNIDVYNCALSAETRYLQRFEFFRHLLNSNRALAAWWATGSRDNKDEMLKWVLEPSQIGSSTPYPILKPFGKYPSVVNIDADHAEAFSNDETTKKTQYNQGRKFGTLTINIQNASNGAPEGANIVVSSVFPNITDKDPAHFNFNYYKVQLPYYNDVGTKNYTDNKVVTGWKIVTISDGTNSFSTGSDATATADENGDITLTTPYNFADRKSTDKDKFGVSGRVFSQGAYFDVPDGVTSITIEPYWANCVYVSDAYLDVVYNQDMSGAANVITVGGGQCYTNKTAYNINGSSQKVYTTMSDAVTALNPSGTVYDNAIVLVGNVHSLSLSSQDKNKPYTIMSIDMDNDNEPDYSYILRFNSRLRVHPVRVDFLTVMGLGMAQKSSGGTGTYNLGIMQPYGWFESTNTSLFRFTQFEYDYVNSNSSGSERTNSPMILQGGLIEQWVTVGGKEDNHQEAKSVTYYHVGGNVWFKEFHIGVHQDKTQDQFVSPHPPISVTGGDYDIFYLTGNYNTPNNNTNDNAECYINGGRFNKVAGTGMQGIGTPGGADNTGNIIWQIDNADINEFYGGGINAAHKSEGDIMTVISNSRVDQFCGGPKFGDMNSGKKVVTNATNCTFRTFFGAGYGGNSYNRRYPENKNDVINMTNPTWDSWVASQYTNNYDSQYNGVETRIDYQFIPMSNNTKNVARLYVDYVSFSLATTRDVTSKLTDCTITTSPLGSLDLFNQCVGNFYGGGNLGMVAGPVKSTLTNCIIEGNVFGGGYSATLPTVSVMDNKFQKEPYYDENLGAYLEAELPSKTVYNWDPEPVQTLNQSNAIDHQKKLLRIQSNSDKLELGTVTGDVTLTINGANTVIGRSVYGGGEESGVGGSISVSVTDGVIGTKGMEEGVFREINGNVFGGGKGGNKDYSLGLVKGNTNVTINGNPTIYHNIYGGGAYGSVGTFTYNEETGMPVYDTSTGKCTVLVNGGTIGIDGKDNGMVFGSSRGDEGNPDEEGSIINKLAWTYNTDVTIGSTSETATALQIYGSVYGGGENGHNFHNTKVTVNKGTIGVEGTITIDEGDPDDESDDRKDTDGPRYAHRGNVYGGGCGTDVYYTSDTAGKTTVDTDGDGIYTWYNSLAGVVGGTTEVNINGGTVVHCVYGAGAMGSVGFYSYNETTQKMELTSGEGTGKCKVNVSGGRIGTFGMQMPDDWGYVFGGGRGETKDPLKYLNIEKVQYVNDTEVTISGKALVTGSVYGGAENGHVLNDTHVTIAGGQIGVGIGKDRAYTEEEWTAENPSSFTECAHWVFGRDDGNGMEYKPYDVYDLENGKPKPASDGHTFYGNVFGGGSGYFPYARRDPAELEALRAIDPGYADGLWLPSAGWVGGNTVVDITGGHILTSVYGGNECTDVDGSCTINMSGGTVGVPRDFEANKNNDNNRLVTCYVFGAGKGDQRINFNQWTNVKSTQVNISGKARIFGSTFGGGEDGHVLEDVETNIIAGNEIGGIQYPYIGTKGTSGADGNIFGGGRGYSETALTAGAVCGNVRINISGGTMLGTVFGGGRLAPVGTHIVLAESRYYGKLIEDGKKQRFGDKDLYKQIFNEIEGDRDPLDEDAPGMNHGYITINISGGTIGAMDKTTGKLAVSNSSIGEVYGGSKGTLNTNLPFGLSRSTQVNITETEESKPHILNSVYGGGEAGNVANKVSVNISGGSIDGDVYGGGAKASTNIKWLEMTDEQKAAADKADYSTTVDLHGGVIGGRVFGGGLGQKEKGTAGEEGYVKPIAAIVGGDVTVNLNKESSDNCVVKKQIFGCNNLNGTPRGNVVVNVYKTQGWDDNDLTEEKSSNAERKNTKYELDAVYGGGNEAAYIPEDCFTAYDSSTGAYTYKPLADDAQGYKTNVNIFGCDQTSVRWVYGGGNSAPTPATSVMVHSCYEIGTVFGGGNGADRVDDGTELGMPNLGANVGYRTYSYVDNNKDFHEFYKESEWPEQSNIWSETKDQRVANYKYGTGRAETHLFGGTIHNAFGGSNTLGNVCAVAFSALNEENEDCLLKVGQIYGAGNKAFMDAKIEVDLGCISGIDELFGGAVEADVNDDVILDVTSGSYKKVFGGNNKGGKISGTITVNVREIGCKPIEIEELYGGGNEADYEAPLDPSDETGTRRLPSPVVNIISATKVGTVYGGGRLANVTGDPLVNINMEPGILNTEKDDGTSNDEPQELGTVGTVFGGGYKGWVKGNTLVKIGTESDKSAHIEGSVFGGGDNADVIGSTNVKIGTSDNP